MLNILSTKNIFYQSVVVEISLGVVTTIVLIWAVSATVGLVIAVNRLSAAKATDKKNQPTATADSDLETRTKTSTGANTDPASPGTAETEPGAGVAGNSSSSKMPRSGAANLAAAAAIRRQEMTNPFLEASCAWDD